MRRLGMIGGCTLALMLQAGCGNSAKMPPVEGRVFFHGNPLPGGTVVFSPDPERGGNGPLSWAMIQPDGRYQLQSKTQLGAVVGWHRVTVLPRSEEGQPSTSLLPRKYADAQHSEKLFEVKADQKNVIDIYLD